MNTKILYVLVSNDKDSYLEQTYLSISSLKKKNPDCRVCLLVDDRTQETLKGERRHLLDIVDEFISVQLPKTCNNKIRSRFLKTSMRNLISGDFLYVDSDTIILDDLSDIDLINYDIAAVADSHVKFDHHPFKSTVMRQFKTIGSDANSIDLYFNSGVLLVKDNAKTRKFFEQWHNNWKKCCEKNIVIDQISLAKTNCDCGGIIKELPGVYNFQMSFGIRYLYNSKILHYLCTNVESKASHPLHFFQDKKVFDKLKQNLTIDKELASKIEEARTLYLGRTKIVYAGFFDFTSTYTVGVLYRIYLKIPFVFNSIEKTIIFFNNINHRLKRLFR